MSDVCKYKNEVFVLKKMGSLFLAFVLCLSLCACTENGGDAVTTTTTDATTTTTSMRLTGPDTTVTTTTEATENGTTTTVIYDVTTTATEATTTTAVKVTTATEATTTTAAKVTTTTKATTTVAKVTTTTEATTTTVATTTTTAPAQNLNPKENTKQDVEYLGYFRVSGDSLLASALMFSGDACVVTDRYFTKEVTESIKVVFNGVSYYSEGGGFTPYRYQLTDTELVVGTSFYEEESDAVSLKAVMLSDGTFKITASKMADFPVGTILSTNIDDVI